MAKLNDTAKVEVVYSHRAEILARLESGRGAALIADGLGMKGYEMMLILAAIGFIESQQSHDNTHKEEEYKDMSATIEQLQQEVRERDGRIAALLKQIKEAGIAPKPARPLPQREQAKAYLQKKLANGAVAASEIAEDLEGIDRGALFRAKKDLGIRSRKGKGGRFFWSLPDD